MPLHHVPHVTVQAVAPCSKHTGNEHSLLSLRIATILLLKRLCALYDRTQTFNLVKHRGRRYYKISDLLDWGEAL